VTGIDGSYQLALGGPLPSDYTLWVDYAGSGALWPAAASAVVGRAPLIASAVALPVGAVGVPYSQVLGASGGMTPYLWVSQGLPPGLSLAQDGTLSGTPMRAGTYAINASVIDGSAPPQYANESLQLVIQ
jgi:hypothetical protein